MLKIINNLSIFWEDCYREFGVREYSRIMKISAPTASKLLKDYEKEGLLKSKIDKGYILFRANREILVLKDLARVYWKYKLDELLNYLNSELNPRSIILFGSLAKLEAKKDSDIDLAVIGARKKLDLSKYEKNFGREIQLFFFGSVNDIPKNLKLNIINGYVLEGELR